MRRATETAWSADMAIVRSRLRRTRPADAACAIAVYAIAAIAGRRCAGSTGNGCRDVHGQITHPLKGVRRVRGCDEHTEVPGHR